jgi:signal transduction histidine kinase
MGMNLAKSIKIVNKRAALLFNIALLYESAGNYKDGVKILDSCITEATQTANYNILADAMNSLGNVYLQVHDSAMARITFQKALKIAVDHSLYKQIGETMGNLALYEGSLNKVVAMQKKAISFMEKQKGNEGEISMGYVNIGLEITKPDSAMVYYFKALHISKNGTLPEVEIAAYNDLAYSYLDKGNINMAVECLVNKAIPVALSINNTDWLGTLYDSYSDVLSAKGDYKSALAASRKSKEYRVQLSAQKNEQQVKLLAAILDVKNKDKTIEEKESEIRTKDIQNRALKLGVVIATLMIIVIIFVFIFFRQKSKLKFKQQQITSARRIIAMEEKEKSRIALELHDNLGYLVKVAEGFIGNLEIEDQILKDNLNGKMKELGDCIRRINHRINIIKDNDSTLEDLMPDIINDMKHFTGIDVDYFIPDYLPKLPLAVNLHICRILQELLTNASKYAKEAKIRLDLALIEKSLVLMYKDNGSGFDPLCIDNECIGIGSIYERVKLLQGKVRLETSPGMGTKWKISIPL